MAKLVVVGGGRMGEALLGGLVASGWADAAELAVVEPVAERRVALAEALPGLVAVDGPAPGVVDDDGGAV
ncbi:MAG: NAD(P)-binding domain-containing protein, partial [Acidimicrobiales bacterium]